MTHRVEIKKWILYRHTNNFDLVTAVAVNLKYFSKTAISNSDKKNLLLKLKELDFYKERNPELPLDAINHRINTLAYYMFGYKGKVGGEDKFLFSPLGNLFLKKLGDKDSISKIFFTMLWGLQYPHPHGGSDPSFQLFPFRLIFKLLSDNRLENKLYAYEVAYYLVFVERATLSNYENLVNNLLEIRKWSNKKIETEFKKNPHVYVNATYEWDYYVSELFKGAGIINKVYGEIITTLTHGKDTLRKLTRNYVQLNNSLIKLCESYLVEYPFDESPIKLNDPKRLKIDAVKEIYSFYPKTLLVSIGELKHQEKNLELLSLPKLIEQYSNNTDGLEAYLFEDVLAKGFELFYNVDVNKIGGVANTDIECLYRTRQKKFAVEAKSTKDKLSNINAGRLASHRDKIGGEYTIVVTPRYVPAVKHDIKSTPIVIIRANTLSEYLYNCIDNDIRKIDYKEFDDIITKNLGTDISNHISDLTIEKFAARRN